MKKLLENAFQICGYLLLVLPLIKDAIGIERPHSFFYMVPGLLCLIVFYLDRIFRLIRLQFLSQHNTLVQNAVKGAVNGRYKNAR